LIPPETSGFVDAELPDTMLLARLSSPPPSMKMPPPWDAVFAEMVLFVMVSTPELSMPPPELAAVLPDIVTPLNVRFPAFAIPPPVAAVPPEMVLLLTRSAPPFAIPPPDPAFPFPAAIVSPLSEAPVTPELTVKTVVALFPFTVTLVLAGPAMVVLDGTFRVPAGPRVMVFCAVVLVAAKAVASKVTLPDPVLLAANNASRKLQEASVPFREAACGVQFEAEPASSDALVTTRLGMVMLIVLLVIARLSAESEAVMVCAPTVSSVAENVPAPPGSVDPAGSMALGSVLVNTTVPP